MNERRCYVASATLMGKIYACGGFDGWDQLRSAEIYDPAIDQWSILPAMMNIRAGAACVALISVTMQSAGFEILACMIPGSCSVLLYLESKDNFSRTTCPQRSSSYKGKECS